MASGKRASMGDVARLAGVSSQTVSRVVNGERYVTAQKKDAVLTAMRELGYRPNAAARAMKRGDFKTIGVLYRSLHPVGNRKALEGIVDAAAAQGYSTLLLPAGGEQPALQQCAIDVAIVIVSSSLGGEADLQVNLQMPTVILSPEAPGHASSVSIDETSGTREAVRHLLCLGHPTVHHIAGPEQSLPARTRENAWRATLAEAGRAIPAIVRGDWSAESGYQATRALLAAGRPTALFAGNDQMALGAYRALFEAGLRVPEDVSVIGCDNIDESDSFPPPLTTLLMDWDLVGRRALQLALGMLDDPTPSALTIPSRLIVRASTAPPAHGAHIPSQ